MGWWRMHESIGFNKFGLAQVRGWGLGGGGARGERGGGGIGDWLAGLEAGAETEAARGLGVGPVCQCRGFPARCAADI